MLLSFCWFVLANCLDLNCEIGFPCGVRLLMSLFSFSFLLFIFKLASQGVDPVSAWPIQLPPSPSGSVCGLGNTVKAAASSPVSPGFYFLPVSLRSPQAGTSFFSQPGKCGVLQFFDGSLISRIAPLNLWLVHCSPQVGLQPQASKTDDFPPIEFSILLITFSLQRHNSQVCPLWQQNFWFLTTSMLVRTKAEREQPRQGGCKLSPYLSSAPTVIEKKHFLICCFHLVNFWSPEQLFLIILSSCTLTSCGKDSLTFSHAIAESPSGSFFLENDLSKCNKKYKTV